MIEIYDANTIGRVCARFRTSQGYRQIDVANDLNFTPENISAFEHGKNDNGIILLWYFAHGLQVADFYRGDTAWI